MIITSPQWPDPEAIHSIRSRASELSRQFSYGSSASHISTQPNTTLLQEPKRNVHRRQQSNPFDVLYDPNSAQLQQRLSPTKSATYIDIENDIHNGHSPAHGFTTSHNRHPTVTLIDDSEIRRGNSTISRLASLRHRNGIRKRTKMVRREDLPDGLLLDELTTSGTESKGKKKAKKPPRLSFLFPVRRRRSFNYYPIKAAPKFSSEDEFENFFQKNNGSQMIRELLPPTMAAYQFTNIISLIPTINIYPQVIQGHPPAPLVPEERQPEAELPLLERVPSPKGRSLAPPRIQRPEQLTYSDNVQYKERIFKSYRQAAFAGKYAIPPKLHEILPLESQYVTGKEKEQLETRLLFELLLRRTIAAKVDFRLKQQGFKKNNEKKPKEKPSQNFSSSSSSGPSDRPDKHLRRKYRLDPKTPKGTKPAKESGNQNASLLSDPLPSPQISFNANMFDPVYNDSPVSIGDWKQRYKLAKIDGSPGKTSNVSVSSSTEAQSNRKAQAQVYVHNFDKVDLVSKKELSTPNLSNVALYSMQPVNRSVATFTSSEEDSPVQNLANFNDHRVSHSTTESKSNSHESSSSGHGEERGKRQSESTTNTSVIQSLEDLSDSVFNYLRSEGAMVHHRYSLDVPLDADPDSLYGSPHISNEAPKRFSGHFDSPKRFERQHTQCTPQVFMNGSS